MLYWLERDAENEMTELWRTPADGTGPRQRLLVGDYVAELRLKINPYRIYWRADCVDDGGGATTFILGMPKP